jgi:hypothetical protein
LRKETEEVEKRLIEINASEESLNQSWTTPRKEKTDFEKESQNRGKEQRQIALQQARKTKELDQRERNLLKNEKKVVFADKVCQFCEEPRETRSDALGLRRFGEFVPRDSGYTDQGS